MLKRNLIAKLTGLLTIGLLIGAGVGFWYKTSSKQAVKAENRKSLPWNHPAMGKMQRSLDIILEAPQGISSSGATLLKAKIHAVQKSSNTLNYVWVLPDTVDLTAGEMSGSLGIAQAGQDFELIVSVNGFGNDSNAQSILLQVFEERDGVRVGGAGSISLDQLTAAEAPAGFQSNSGNNLQRPKIHQ